jgi:hypothetical protein
VERIRTAALPGDGVVVTSRAVFDGMAPFLPDHEVRLYTRGDGEYRQAAFEALWGDFVTRHSRIWLVLDYAGGQSADWNAYLAEGLGQEGYQTSDEWVGPEQRLLHFATTPPANVRVEEMDVVLGNEVELLRVTLDGEPLRGGQVLSLELQWQAPQELGANYSVFVHLVSGEGQIHAQRDAPLPASGGAQSLGVLLPRDLQPGTYHLRIGVYDPATGNRLTLPTGEDSIVIEGIEIR